VERVTEARLCFLIGESFVKVSNNERDVYGKVYRARKEREVTRNAAGDYADRPGRGRASPTEDSVDSSEVLKPIDQRTSRLLVSQYNTRH
jgi:hypothetical protein